MKLGIKITQGCTLLLLGALTTQLSAVENEKFISFKGKRLSDGKQVWIQNCKTCHAYGIASAPIPMEPKQWQHRLAKKTSTLYAHAIDGYFGPDDSWMPPRGGNPKLTDVEVKIAVDYMVSLARHYLLKQNELKTISEEQK